MKDGRDEVREGCNVSLCLGTYLLRHLLTHLKSVPKPLCPAPEGNARCVIHRYLVNRPDFPLLADDHVLLSKPSLWFFSRIILLLDL